MPDPTSYLSVRKPSSQAAMSLLEVMMALTVMAVGVFGAMSNFVTLAAMRKQTTEAVSVRAIMSALAERFQGARWETLGVVEAAPWSMPRLEPGPVDAAAVAAASPPLTDDINLTVSERATRGLQTLGLAQSPSTLPNLRIYVEYYRSLTARNDDGDADTALPGIMDNEPGGVDYTSTTDFQQRYRFEVRWEDIDTTVRSTIQANRNTYRLATSSAPTAQVGENDPISIRILATWGEQQTGVAGNHGQFAVFTSRKR